MKNITKIIGLILVTAMLLTLAACNSEPADNTVAKVLTLKGPTGLGMLEMMDKNEKSEEKGYEFGIMSSPDEMKTEVVLGNYDIAAVPINLASALYKVTEGKLMVAAINTLGVLYILENGETITNISDLKGKTIYCAGGGSTPEYVLKYILEKNGIDPEKDVTLDFSFTDHAELAAFAAEGTFDVVMLPQPNVTSALVSSKEGDLRIALNLTEEWDKVCDTKLIQGCIVVRKEFAEAHPAKLKAFLEEYNASVEYVNTNVDSAAALAEHFGIIPKAALAKKAIPGCNITFIDGEEMKNDMKAMLEILYEAAPSSVGGKLPDDAFYYIAK